MPDIAATLALPAYRAWHDMLRAPSFLDKDVLLAAGVIKDDEDWLEWHDRGWLGFIVKAADEQAVALFELVQAGTGAGPAQHARAEAAIHQLCFPAIYDDGYANSDYSIAHGLYRMTIDFAAGHVSIPDIDEAAKEIEAKAMLYLAISLGFMISDLGEGARQAVFNQITRSRDFYRDKAAKSVSLMGAAGNA